MTDDFVADALARLQPVEPRREFADALFEQFSAGLSDEVPVGEASASDVLVGDLEPQSDDADDDRRLRRRLLLVAVAAVVVAVLVVAAGVLRGSDSRVEAMRPAPPTKQQFIAGVDTICRDDDAALARLYTQSPPSRTGLQSAIIVLLGEVVARVDKLGLPPADAARLQPALDDLRTAHQLARDGLASYAAVRRGTQVLFDYGAGACNPDLVPLYPTITVP